MRHTDLRRPIAWGSSVLFAVSALVACGDGASEAVAPPPTPIATSLVIATPAPTLFRNQSLTLDASVLDQFGKTMAGQAIAWSSSDPTAATVSSDGVATGVDAGVAVLTASSGNLLDEVDVTVRYDVVVDEARFRVRGDVDGVWSFKGEAIFRDVLGTTSGDASVLYFANDPPFLGLEEWGIQFALPGSIAAATVQLGEWDENALWETPSFELGTALGYLLRYDDDYDRITVFKNTGESRVEIEDASLPPGPGAVEGLVKGRIVFEGAGYSADMGVEYLTPTGETVTVFGDFWIPLGHFPLAGVTAVTTGGPLPGTLERVVAWFDWEEESSWEYESTLSVNGWLDDDHQCWIEVTMPEYRPGSYALGEPDLFGGAGHAWVDSQVYSDYAIVMDVGSESGTLQIATLTPPQSNELTGEMIGSVNAAMVDWVWENGALVPGDMRSNLVLNYHVPLFSALYPWYSSASVKARERVTGPWSLEAAGPIEAVDKESRLRSPGSN